MLPMNTDTNTCFVCKQAFEVSYKKREQKACSKSCAYKLRSVTRSTQHVSIEKFCAVCADTFQDSSKKGLVTKCKTCIYKSGVQTRRKKGTYERTELQNKRLSETLQLKYAEGWNPNSDTHRAKLSISMRARWQSGRMRSETAKTCQLKYGVDHWMKSGAAREMTSIRSSGHVKSDETRRRLAVSHANRIVSGHCVYTRGKGGFRQDIGFYVRSRWEANFARILQHLQLPFVYEKHTFHLSDGRTYTPDFCIDGTVWIELKGYMNETSRAKIDQFRKDYPDEILWIVGPDVYKILKQHYINIVNWENK